MKGSNILHYWTIWYPGAAATGLLIARALVEPADTVLLHAPAPLLMVELTDQAGQWLAHGKELERTADTPMCRLRRVGGRIEREDIWPGAAEVGAVVILPGGEAGILQQWWHADDKQEWRWQVEFYNTLR